MSIFRWMSGNSGDGFFDLLIGSAILFVVGVIILIFWWVIVELGQGHWQPFAWVLGITILLSLAVCLGHLARLFLKDKDHSH